MQSKEDINSTYKTRNRIEAEKLSLDSDELLRARTKSGGNCYMPRMVVIPPRMDFNNIIVQEESTETDSDNDSAQRSDSPLWNEILCLLDNTSKEIYGEVAYTKHYKQSITDIHRLDVSIEGVVINIALVEPFGLTLIEAAAHMLPMVAMKNGDPIGKNLWDECRQNGLKNIHLYSWPQHCRIYLSRARMIDEGYEGEDAVSTLLEVADRIQKYGLRDLTKSKTPESLEYGKKVHVHAIRNGFDSNVFLENPFADSITALMSGVVVWMVEVSIKLNSVIQPLMVALKWEQDEVLQEKAIEELAKIISQCVRCKSGPNDKLIKNMCYLICVDPLDVVEASNSHGTIFEKSP
eukprot:Gb_13184 [translate_table: standard]